jgi:tRNA nucleotidyltransferase (CCA-adding enzyme)
MSSATEVSIPDWMASADPAARLRQLRASGWLAEHFPELDRLYGVPQVEEHHPEIDTGIHIELVLEVAARLTTDPRARWAALVHDLGKGLTPKEQYPQHINHEKLGEKPAREVARRFRLPDDWGWLGAAVSVHHLQAHRCLEMRANSTIKFIREAGFPSRPTLFECFVVACEADARGRAGMTERAYPQAGYLREVYGIVREFEAKYLKLEQETIRTVEPLLKKHGRKGANVE